MRLPTLSLFLAAVACSGNSLYVGSDESGNGGDAGDGGTSASGATGTGSSSSSGGSSTGGNAGNSPATGGTGAGAAPSGGASGAAPNGGTSSGATSSGGARPTPTTPSITSCTDEFPYVGVWEGSVLDFYFEPVEALRLVVVANEQLGGYEASLTFGMGEVPPPFDDPDEPFPSLEYWQEVSDIDARASIEPWPGFVYSIVRGAGCDDVLRVSVSVAEPWDAWCQAQDRVYTPGHGWACTYQGGGSISTEGCSVQDGGSVVGTYPIWKCMACGAFEPGVCECTEDYCGSSREPTHSFELELGTSGGVDVLSGTDTRCEDCTVRLERVE